MIESLGEFNLRTRISACILCLTPLIYKICIIYPDILNISSTILILIVLYAISNLMIIFCNIKLDKIRKNNPDLMVAQHTILYGDTEIFDNEVRNKRIEYLKSKIGIDSDTDITQDNAGEMVRWLINKTRDKNKYPIIYEENINFTFMNNMLALKTYGVVSSISSILISITYLYFSMEINIINIIVHFILDIIMLTIWILLIKQSNVKICGKRYARALFKSCIGMD